MKFLIPILPVTAFFACSPAQPAEDELTIQIANTLDHVRKDVFITLPADKIKRHHPGWDWSKAALFCQDTPIPFQTNDIDQNGQPDEIAWVADLDSRQSRQLTSRSTDFTPAFPKRTQAELSHKTGGIWEDRKYIGGTFTNVTALRVPPEHTDHSAYIRYEGPGWESDKIGYRFYLDWRNAPDVFGKLTPGMTLQKIGLDDFNSYHRPSEWGMDVLRVGSSMGLGGFGSWTNGKVEKIAVADSIFCEIVLNGPVQSMVRTRYFGWETGKGKTDLVSEMSITAGSRLTRHDISINESPDSLCTGLAKAPQTVFLHACSQKWGYMATWGKQSPNHELLGMAVLYPTSQFLELTADEENYLAVLKTIDDRLSYYFLAAWEKEPGGITSLEAFERYLKETLEELESPVSVTAE